MENETGASPQDNENNTGGSPANVGASPHDAPLTLSDGRKFTVRKLKGKDVVETQKIIGNNAEKFLAAGMALAVQIEGKPVIMEDLLENESYEDYLLLMAEFSKVNFTSVQVI